MKTFLHVFLFSMEFDDLFLFLFVKTLPVRNFFLITHVIKSLNIQSQNQSHSLCYIFLVLLLISLQNLLYWPQHPLKRLPVDRKHQTLAHALYTCLTRHIFYQSNLPKIIPLTEFVHLLTPFLSYQGTLCNQVKLVPFFAFPDYIVFLFVTFFKENITKLLLLIGIYF